MFNRFAKPAAAVVAGSSNNSEAFAITAAFPPAHATLNYLPAFSIVSPERASTEQSRRPIFPGSLISRVLQSNFAKVTNVRVDTALKTLSASV